MQVHVAQADIATLPVDAIVNLSNSQGVMKGGPALRLRDVGGEAIEAEAMSHAPIAVGAAAMTTGGELRARHVIHAPLVTNPGESPGIENIRRAARAALLAASHNKLKVIAFPGARSDGLPLGEAARAITEELRAHKGAFPETVYLVDIDELMVEAFEAAVHNASAG